MFVWSVKTSKKQLLSILLCVILLIAILVVVIVWPSDAASAQTFSPAAAASDGERVAYLKSLGYEVAPEAVEVREILVPDEFDDVFTKYNEVQKGAGMDLQPYHGKRLKCWTYEVKNHPSGDGVLAHLYVYKDKIVGGDIASTAVDGFMHGLTKLQAEK